MVGKECNGSTVVEMAYLMPVVLLTWMLIIFALFYYHDKNIIAGAAYETAVVTSELARTENEVPTGKAEQYFQDRIRGKLLFFGGADAAIAVGETEITVRASAAAKGLSVSAEKRASTVIAEKKIRKIKILKQKIERNRTE